jgi:hypothetical protein
MKSYTETYVVVVVVVVELLLLLQRDAQTPLPFWSTSAPS